MTEATLRVNFAGPLVTIQDRGRAGQMRFGVANSGPMDRLSAAAANSALGNAPDATLIEVSMGGVMLECVTGALSVALAGGAFAVGRAGDAPDGWSVFALEQGDKLTIRPGKSGSWTYLAVAGTLVANRWLGSAATHSTSGFGGGQLTLGQTLTITDARVHEDRHGSIQRPDFLPEGDDIRVVMGPQDRHFSDAALAAFQSQPFALTSAFDRMGVRLSGPELSLNGALSIPSEAITRGSVQVAGDGVPTVLLSDHQTTGGYPKIATVISGDVDRISQKRAGDPVRFVPVSPKEAVQITRDAAQFRDAYLATISEPKGTLEQRLMRANLISGAIADDEMNEG
jgi:allophanate hydrolase